MKTTLLSKVFGSRNTRLIKKYMAAVTAINSLSAQFKALSDIELRAKTAEFKDRLAHGASLDILLPEAFATVREASTRVLGLRHYDVQLVGGMVLHEGKIAEMRTGEGKTLMATLPAYLNGLAGAGVHVITVNDYLARRDAEETRPVFEFLGLTVGINLAQLSIADKQAAYAADVTYGTNNEFGFDYLRDNMVYNAADKVQRKLSYAIIDEVDSILIDEARTPLIISGESDDNLALYTQVNHVIPQLIRQTEENGPGDFWIDEKARTVLLTESGHERVERLLAEAGLLLSNASLYDAANISLIHHVYAGLRAHVLYHRDQHYVVQESSIVIVDELTGRVMPGRRWSEGLHQAVEAKEGVPLQKENQTMASITFQNYFRMVPTLAGMTGTAETEAFELHQTYGLETVVIPAHRPLARVDMLDRVFRTASEKYDAILLDIDSCYRRGQPVLVGTTSIEQNEHLSRLLTAANLPHAVLNAKQHDREADIIAQAGKLHAITIATNMAGRGTDIILGGNLSRELAQIRQDISLSDTEKQAKLEQLQLTWKAAHASVLAAGGLHIIGTERHESRRVDNQLRGRSGRQGDVGSSRFYLSLEDPLLRIFAAARVATIMDKLQVAEGEAIEHVWVSRAIENAQHNVEARNFEMRKQLLEYDDVASAQRKIIYAQRDLVLTSDSLSELLTLMREEVLRNVIEEYAPVDSMVEQWDVMGLTKVLTLDFKLNAPVQTWLEEDSTLGQSGLVAKCITLANETYEAKVSIVGSAGMHQFEQTMLLNAIDTHWRDQLAGLAYLREGINLRTYAQKNPMQEYKKEAFMLYSDMLSMIRLDAVQVTLGTQLRSVAEIPADLVEHIGNLEFKHQTPVGVPGDPHLSTEKPVNFTNVPRNAACPCGSGNKFKACHGKLSVL